MEEEHIYLTPLGLKNIQKIYQQICDRRVGEMGKRRSRISLFLENETKDPDLDIAADEEILKEQIAEYEFILNHYRLVAPPNGGKKSKVGLGATVFVEINGCLQKLHIVGSPEADPDQGKISHLSPVAEALMGRTVGEEIEVNVDFPETVKIKKIQY